MPAVHVPSSNEREVTNHYLPYGASTVPHHPHTGEDWGLLPALLPGLLPLGAAFGAASSQYFVLSLRIEPGNSPLLPPAPFGGQTCCCVKFVHFLSISRSSSQSSVGPMPGLVCGADVGFLQSGGQTAHIFFLE